MTGSSGPTRDERRALRAALVDVAPWLTDHAAGPTTVDAGQCDRCDQRPRVLPTCGPVVWPALCRDCALDVGSDGWCDGHADHAADLLAWAAALPAWWGDAVVLWWVATGEVTGPTAQLRSDLPQALRAALPRAGTDLT